MRLVRPDSKAPGENVIVDLAIDFFAEVRDGLSDEHPADSIFSRSPGRILDELQKPDSIGTPAHILWDVVMRFIKDDQAVGAVTFTEPNANPIEHPLEDFVEQDVLEFVCTNLLELVRNLRHIQDDEAFRRQEVVENRVQGNLRFFIEHLFHGVEDVVNPLPTLLIPRPRLVFFLLPHLLAACVDNAKQIYYSGY